MKPFNQATITLAAMLAFALTLASVPGATIPVTSTADNGPGSLRAALASAANGDTIDATGISGTILLTNGELVVSTSSTILGPGPAKLSVDGNGTNRVFRVAPSNTVTISSLTVTNGAGPNNVSPGNRGGGGILNYGSTLSVSNCVISGNYSGGGHGGGIFNDAESGGATLSITASTLSGNSAAFGEGGGIFNRGSGGVATLVVSNCLLSGNFGGNGGAGIVNDGDAGGSAVLAVSASILSGNTGGTEASGGAIFNVANGGNATLTISHCIISGNTAGAGGGINNFGWLGGRASAQIVSSTVSSNSADSPSFSVGGGIYNAGNDYYEGSASVQLVNSTLSGNQSSEAGGGLYNRSGRGPANAEVVSSTASGNSSDFGGGIYNSGTLMADNSTLSGNSAYQGGGLANFGTNSSRIVSSTLSENSAAEGGGIYNSRTATLELGSTILKAGVSGGSITNFLGFVASLGYNLSSDSGGGLLTNATDQLNTDPLLGPLQDNGGPTFTHALLCGSPAIDKGKNLAALASDQRGLPRAFDNPFLANGAGGDGTDIGAFEQQGICLESPCAGVGVLVAAVGNSSLPDNRKRPLLVSLGAACESFEHEHLNAGINQLQAFEQKVRAQVEKSDPALASRLMAISEAIIGALGGG